MSRKRTKQLKKQVTGAKRPLEKHTRKIQNELQKPNPDWGRIRHWEREMANWLRDIEKKEKQLGRRK
jgi:hypothetical protein